MDTNRWNDYGYMGQEPQREKHGGMLWLGMFFGALITAVFFGVVIFAYPRITGQSLIIGGKGIQTAESELIIDEEAAAKLDELTSYMTLYYYDEFASEDVQNSIYSGLVAGLKDPYSVYYTAEEYEDLQVSTRGTYHGIGAGLSQDLKTMQVTITRVYEGTPSEEAGLKKDDVILFVNDTDAASVEVSLLVQQIRGEEGTTVHLQIYRPSTGETLDFDVERRNVELPSVEGELLADAIGYIQITEFQANTAGQFADMLSRLEAQGMKELIVDVRGNPGGLLTSVVDVLDILLPEGTVVYMEDKYGTRETFTSDESCKDYPLVVLMDENSASASEIFAGAIRDYEYGTLVGTTTFGKGIVQSIFPLKDGDAIKLTTAKYFTPSGLNIHGTGIEPDVEIPYEYTGPKDEEYEKQYDNQLQKAIEVLHED